MMSDVCNIIFALGNLWDSLQRDSLRSLLFSVGNSRVCFRYIPKTLYCKNLRGKSWGGFAQGTPLILILYAPALEDASLVLNEFPTQGATFRISLDRKSRISGIPPLLPSNLDLRVPI